MDCNRQLIVWAGIAILAACAVAQEHFVTAEQWTVAGKKITVRSATIAAPVGGTNTVRIVHDGARVITVFDSDKGKTWTRAYIVDTPNAAAALKKIAELRLVVGAVQSNELANVVLREKETAAVKTDNGLEPVPTEEPK